MEAGERASAKLAWNSSDFGFEAAGVPVAHVAAAAAAAFDGRGELPRRTPIRWTRRITRPRWRTRKGIATRSTRRRLGRAPDVPRPAEAGKTLGVHAAGRRETRRAAGTRGTASSVRGYRRRPGHGPGPRRFRRPANPRPPRRAQDQPGKFHNVAISARADGLPISPRLSPLVAGAGSAPIGAAARRSHANARHSADAGAAVVPPPLAIGDDEINNGASPRSPLAQRTPSAALFSPYNMVKLIPAKEHTEMFGQHREPSAADWDCEEEEDETRRRWVAVVAIGAEDDRRVQATRADAPLGAAAAARIWRREIEMERVSESESEYSTAA